MPLIQPEPDTEGRSPVRAEENDYDHCLFCGRRVLQGQLSSQEGLPGRYCLPCTELDLRECPVCHVIFRNRAGCSFYNHRFCGDCFIPTVPCSRCREPVSIIPYRFTFSNAGPNIYCSHCLEMFSDFDLQSLGLLQDLTPISGDSQSVCSLCKGGYSARDGIDFGSDIGFVCHYCLDNKVINNYSYKPKPILLFCEKEHKEGVKGIMTYGVELEVELVIHHSSSRNHLLEHAIRLPKEVYCKRDSSIHCGFEIVSHPASFNWWKENRELVEKILLLRKQGFRSFDTETCGIHIHMTKGLFSTTDIQKLHDFFRYNPGFILMLSQRKKSKLEQWAGIYHPGDAKVYYKCINKRGSGERHVAINLNSLYTIEIRIFRGTLNTKSFYKNIEFCDALFLFIKDVSMAECTLENFLKFVVFNKEKYDNLYEFLKSRLMFVGDGI